MAEVSRNFNLYVTVTYEFDTGRRRSTGEPITETRTRGAWLRQVPIPTRDSATFLAGTGSASNPTRWRERYIEGVSWAVGNHFTWRGVKHIVVGVQPIGRFEVEVITED